MKRTRLLIGFLVLFLVAGVGLIAWQPVHEANKGQRALTDGKQLIQRLKSGKKLSQSDAITVPGKTTSSEQGASAHYRADTAVSIPSVGINLAIYKTPAGLPYGVYAELAGVKASTAPGDNNYVLAGHSSYLKGVLFANLFQLTTSRGYVRHAGAPYRPSDYQGGQGKGGLIEVYTPTGMYTYQADSAYTVNGNDASILNDPPTGSAKQIHLFTCPRTGHKHPPFRYVVQGHLVKITLNKFGVQKHLDTSLNTSNQMTYQESTLTGN